MHSEQGAFPGIDTDGGRAEYIRTSARACVPLPGGVEPADVAAHANAGLTAYHAVKKALPRLYPGTTAVVIDFVGEGGALAEGFAKTRQDGVHHIVGYGGTWIRPRSTSSRPSAASWATSSGPTTSWSSS